MSIVRMQDRDCRDYYIAPADFPSDRTYEDLLSDLDDGFHPNNTFVEINKFDMIQDTLDDYDYEVFWKCMKLFSAYGKNYFKEYLSLKLGRYDSFFDGIEHWFYCHGLWCQHTDVEFLNLVRILHFFCISSYYGIPISDFDTAAAKVDSIYQRVLANESEQHKANSRAGAERRISSYFNFDNYSETTFKHLFDGIISDECNHSISIDEAIVLARQAPLQMYVVIFKKGGKVNYVAKTEHLLQYIGTTHKRLNADSVRFSPVNPEYADDLLISLKVFYDLPLDHIRPSVANRKYGTVNQAIFVYKRAESIPKKKVLAAIEDNHNHLRVIDLGNGQELIDKIKLHRVLFHIPEPEL